MATTLEGGGIVCMGVGGEEVDFILCDIILEGIKGYKEGSWKIV